MKRFVPRLAIAMAVMLGATALGGWAPAPSKATPDTSNRDQVVQIYLARHGETILNSLERVQGWSDSPLTESGRAVAQKIGTNLGKELKQFDAAYSADMVRHYETATLMLQAMGSKKTPPVVRDEGLRELNFGGFEGAEQSEMFGALFAYLGPEGIANAKLPELTDAIKAVSAQRSDLPAENCADVDARMMASLNSIAADAAKHRLDDVLVISSGMSISCVLFELGAGDRVPPTGLANGAVNLLEYKAGTWTVKTVNDTHYAD